MDILNTVSLESNSQIKINFDGGDLSSDAGLLLFKEFLFKIGAVKLVNRMFKTNDTAWLRMHVFIYNYTNSNSFPSIMASTSSLSLLIADAICSAVKPLLYIVIIISASAAAFPIAIPFSSMP